MLLSHFSNNSVNLDAFPKTFERFGVSVSPLGRPTIDSIEFCQRLESSGVPFCFWLQDENIAVHRWNYFGHSLLTVNVYSLTKFYKGRSSAVLTDYFAPLRRLNECINDAPTIQADGLCFDAFRSEITLVDSFVDLRFPNRRKSEMKDFFDRAAQMEIEHFQKTEDYDGTIYWHNGLTLEHSTEVLRMYFKEAFKPRNKGDELNRYKIRFESSHQNKGKSKIINDVLQEVGVKRQSKYHLERKKRIVGIDNPHLSNAFTVLNQPIINRLFDRLAAPILTA
jgi:hypothetical protein